MKIEHAFIICYDYRFWHGMNPRIMGTLLKLHGIVLSENVWNHLLKSCPVRSHFTTKTRDSGFQILKGLWFDWDQLLKSSCCQNQPRLTTAAQGRQHVDLKTRHGDPWGRSHQATRMSCGSERFAHGEQNPTGGWGVMKRNTRRASWELLTLLSDVFLGVEMSMWLPDSGKIAECNSSKATSVGSQDNWPGE